MNKKNTFGETIRQLRISKEYKLRQFAKVIDISPSYFPLIFSVTYITFYIEIKVMQPFVISILFL